MESEVIEIFNELVIELNISDPDTNETCFYEDHHHEENNATEDHHEEEHDDHEEEHDEEHEEEHEVTPFCASLYSLARQMMLSLNYTTLSCLENGTVEGGSTATEPPSSRTNPSLGESSMLWTGESLYTKDIYIYVHLNISTVLSLLIFS